MRKKALILLENGYSEYCNAFAGDGTVFSEFVFNTSMTGYEEILTDPSYKGQTVVFTYPLIGNYGITDKDFQSKKIQSDAIIIREASNISSNFRADRTLGQFLESSNVIGIDRVDTRSLTRQIRNSGALQGAISTEILDIEQLKASLDAAPSISDTDMYKLVIDNKVNVFEGNQESQKSIIAIDFGIKSNIIQDLQKDYKKIYLVPYDDNFQENIKSIEFDGVFLSNGPGDPRIVQGIVEDIKSFVEAKKPVIAICFGHQLIGRAFNLNVVKLPFGHHGGNHPAKYLPSGKVYITAQNHNYAVDKDSIFNSKQWEMTWENLYDNTVEGMKHKELPINSIQFHPEASPGPNEANAKVFSDFYETVCNM